MKIPYQLLKEWEQLKSNGDVQKIADRAGVSRMTVYRAFKEEVCNDDLIEVIAEFYKEKRDMVNELLSDYND